MKVALIGATGAAGSRILGELRRRGHEVIALARQAAGIPAQPGVVAKSVDANDAAALSAAIRGVEAVISATKFKDASTESLIDAVRMAGIPRYLVVGGAGSLETAPGVLEMDSPKFPEHVLPEARAGAAFLGQLRGTGLDWTFLSPSRFFEPGTRTGQYRVGKDELLVGADGRSAISMEDYAIAMVDELENPRHLRQRFTVGY
jgi:putative NADH-flavin reductase